MEHIKFSFELLKNGLGCLPGGYRFTKDLPTAEGVYFIGANGCQDVDTIELMNFSLKPRDHIRLGFRDYDGELVYIDECNFDWLVTDA